MSVENKQSLAKGDESIVEILFDGEQIEASEL
jgi:hypothetical protein